MRTIDCVWERKNLGVRVKEIILDDGERFDAAAIAAAAEGAGYVVLKVPVGDPDFLFGLPALGYTWVETQMTVGKRFVDFDFDDRLVRVLSRGIRFVRVEDNSNLEAVVASITEDMFQTDRISLDPHFGPAVGRIRYVNWIRSVFSEPDVLLFEFVKGESRYGFSLCRRKPSGEWDYVLGGIYGPYANSGLGLLTPAAPFLYARDTDCPFTRLVTGISSNNTPVVRLYAHLGYVLDRVRHVYVKHFSDER